jgi:hypothetical protein
MADEEWKPKAGDFVEAQEDFLPCWYKGNVFLLVGPKLPSFTCLETVTHEFAIEKPSFKLLGSIEKRESEGIPNPDLEQSFDTALAKLMIHTEFRAQLNVSIQVSLNLADITTMFLYDWFDQAGFLAQVTVNCELWNWVT